MSTLTWPLPRGIGFRASIHKFLLNQLDIEWSNNNQCSFQVKMFCLGLRASLIPIVGSHGQAKCKDSWLKINRTFFFASWTMIVHVCLWACIFSACLWMYMAVKTCLFLNIALFWRTAYFLHSIMTQRKR